MAIDVLLKPEGTVYKEIELKSVRVDQRIMVEPRTYERPKKEISRCKPLFSKRTSMFLITGKATQAEKDALETASKKWWQEGSGKTKGRVRFKWTENNGGEYYECAIRKADFTQPAAHEKYDYIIELVECTFE